MHIKSVFVAIYLFYKILLSKRLNVFITMSSTQIQKLDILNMNNLFIKMFENRLLRHKYKISINYYTLKYSHTYSLYL